MESKTSFFNFKMIRRDIKMHWPIWAITLAGYLLSCTTIISLEGNHGLFSSFGSNPDFVVAYDIIEMLNGFTQLFSACLGFVVAAAAFGYLGKRRKHYFYESLPFTKLSLFATRFLFGICILFIPVFSIYIIEILQSTLHGYCAIGELTQWLIISIAEYLFWYALGILVIVISGRLAMAGFCYIAIAVVWLVFEAVLDVYAQLLYFGVHSGLGLLFNLSDKNIFSPVEFFESIDPNYSSEVKMDLYPDGTFLKVLIALVAAALLVVLAYVLYKRRKAEKTEDNFVFAPVKVIFSYCFAFFFSLGFTLFFTGLFISSDEGQAHIASRCIGILVLIIICGFIGYMASCMIVEKRFKIFKENMVKCCIFLAVISIFMIAMFHDVFRIERYVPDKNNCTEAAIASDYTYDQISYSRRYYQKQAVDKLVEAQQMIIDNMDDLVFTARSYWDYERVSYNNISLTFVEKGKSFRRNYYVRENSKLDKMLEQFFDENRDIFKKARLREDDYGHYEYNDNTGSYDYINDPIY